MKNNSCLLLTHIHIYENERYKKDILEYALTDFKNRNPNYHIILSGHGLQPNNNVKDNLCDTFLWDDNVISNEIGKGHPTMVRLGLNKALDLGFKYIFKTRADSIFLRNNIVEFCNEVLENESKKIMLSYGTCYDKRWAGDLTMFCSTDLLDKIWIDGNWNYSTNGLENLGNGIEKTFGYDGELWLDFLRKHICYKDPVNLKWVDLLGPHPHNSNKWNLIKSDSNFEFNYEKYVWGKDWHIKNPYTVSEDTFYDN